MLLAIDSSTMPACAALVDDNTTIAEFTVNYKKTHSQTLMPLIEKMFEITDIDLKELDFIACSRGPGSFTGLRIGAACAKGLAFGLGIKIIPITTLDYLAYNIFDTNKLVCPIMDARCNQVYSAIYKWNQKHNSLEIISDYFACNIQEIINKVMSLNQDVIFLGDGVNVHQNIITKNIPAASFAPPHCNMQRAASLGSFAQALSKEKAIDPSDFTLFYLRKPQAERELDKQAADSQITKDFLKHEVEVN